MAESERPSSPLNLSLRHPGFPKAEPKCEDASQLKSPAALSPSLGVSPPRGASPPSVWSRGETARIWSPAVTCEKENRSSSLEEEKLAELCPGKDHVEFTDFLKWKMSIVNTLFNQCVKE